MKKRKTMLSVTYNSNLYSKGFDDVIEKGLNKRCVGSGMGMGERDIEFEYNTESEAKTAGTLVEKIKGVTSTNIYPN